MGLHPRALRPAAAGVALVVGIALSSCASSTGDVGVGDRTAASIPTPGPGAATVALLHFSLPGGVTHTPALRVTNGFRQPASAAFVGGIARVGPDANRYVGLVAVVNFKSPGANTIAAAGSAEIGATQPFALDYHGGLTSAGPQASNVRALLRGVAGPQAWTVDWFDQPDAGTDASRPFVADGQALLDTIFRHLAGIPSPGFLQAVEGAIDGSGSPSPPGQVALGSSGGSTPATPRVSGPRGTPTASSRPPLPGGRQSGGAGPPAGAGSAGGAGQPGSPPGAGSPAAPGSGGPAAPAPSPVVPPGPQPAPAPGSGGGSGAAASIVEFSTTPGPGPAGSRVQATAMCPGGTVLVGGGLSLHTASGALPNNSLRAMGTVPSASDGSPAGSGTARGWTAVGGAGGQPMTDAVTDNFAVCATGVPGSTEVVVQSVPGPATAASSTAATASCPSGTTLVSGGASTLVPPSPIQPSLHLIGSYPSDAAGHPAASGAPTSWTAVGAAGGALIANSTTTAFAVCSSAPLGVHAIAVTGMGPEAATTQTVLTASCPAGSHLLGGGVDVSLGGGTPQQGVHITGDYPSDASGAPVSAGSGANAWTAITHSGGQAAPGTQSAAFAMCGTLG